MEVKTMIFQHSCVKSAFARGAIAIWSKTKQVQFKNLSPRRTYSFFLSENEYNSSIKIKTIVLLHDKVFLFSSS